jgi:hypothetical protein
MRASTGATDVAKTSSKGLFNDPTTSESSHKPVPSGSVHLLLT